MSSGSGDHERDHRESLALYALQALPASEVPVVESQISGCASCQEELQKLRAVTDAFVSWPTDVLRPSTSLWERLTRRIATETGQEPVLAPPRRPGAEWEEAAPGIFCQLLATDTEQGRVSMLVRLAPGAEYPPHTHAGVEEVYMLDGVLIVDEKKLYPGNYLRSEPGTTDNRIWSETGCSCVLLTSYRDVLS
jgi:ChrR Cupin-like domain